MKYLIPLLLSALSATAVILPLPTNPPPAVSLAWNAAGTNVITNYWIWYGVSTRSYTNKVAAKTNLSLTVSNLTRGVTFYFTASAQDTHGLESDWSNEVNYSPPVAPLPPDLLPAAVLTVQSAPVPAGPWSTTSMNWSVAADQPSQAFRLQIVSVSPPAPPQDQPLTESFVLPPAVPIPTVTRQPLYSPKWASSQ